MTDVRLLHASCVAVAGRGLLILGPSGAGKSALALQLMALGADLIADDQTEVRLEDAALIARCPPTIHGLIEARGVGLLRAPALAETALVLAVDLGQTETQRLPPRRSLAFFDTPLDLVFGNESRHFPSALLCYLKGTRQN